MLTSALTRLKCPKSVRFASAMLEKPICLAAMVLKSGGPGHMWCVHMYSLHILENPGSPYMPFARHVSIGALYQRLEG